MSGIQQNFAYGRSFGAAPGQQAYTTAGTYSWVAPTGVTSVSVVTVGAGANNSQGGALAYKNNITVIPGDSYTVVVQPGNTSGSNRSSFISIATVSAGAGIGFRTGDGGGDGGTSDGLAGGGAGGYSGDGGSGAATGTDGTGGGGGGGSVRSGGGGVGLLGQGSSGIATGGGGTGGSGGTDGQTRFNPGGDGGVYGGGRGSSISNGNAGGGAVRIIWPGTTRAFPSTNTGNL